MCQRCNDIDYPVADCWRPCYVPPGRSRDSKRSPRGLIPLWTDESDALRATIERLEKENHLLTLALSQLRAGSRPSASPTQCSSLQSFTGVDDAA